MNIYIYMYIYICVYVHIVHTYVYNYISRRVLWGGYDVGSLKLKVSFVKEPYKRDYILQKRPMILRSLLIVGIPDFYLERGVSRCHGVF